MEGPDIFGAGEDLELELAGLIGLGDMVAAGEGTACEVGGPLGCE